MLKRVEEVEISIIPTGAKEANPSTEVRLDITQREKITFPHIINIGGMISNEKEKFIARMANVTTLLAVAAIELSKSYIPPQESPLLHQVSSYIEHPYTISAAALAAALLLGRSALRSRRRLRLIDDKAHQILVGPLPPAQTESPPPTDDQMPN